jgi:hypothetical protein
MKKKQKRQTRSGASNLGGGTPAGLKTATPSTFVARATKDDFAPDYTYVAKDLRRIGILAGIFFVVLIALALVFAFVIY